LLIDEKGDDEHTYEVVVQKIVESFGHLGSNLAAENGEKNGTHTGRYGIGRDKLIYKRIERIHFPTLLD
jgi:hypothetical protein